MYNLVKKMKAQGVPIDGVGFQGHFTAGNVPKELEDNLRTMSEELDVEVAITELDIGIDAPATKAKLEQQAKDYAFVYNACQNVKRCVGVTVWDWCDRYSYDIKNLADLWDVNLKPKPAVEAVKNVLKRKALH